MLPNFLVIGAQKATTSLFHYLRQHPDVYMNSKDPRFFAFEGAGPDSVRGPGARDIMTRKTVTHIEGYRALFAGVRAEKAVGETSPIYLYVPHAADRIKHYVPNAKLIAVLRHPVERAYSAYLLLARYGLERLGFSEALRQEPARIADRWHPIWHYRSRGFYHAQLSRYYRRFDKEQIGVYLYDDLTEDPVGTTQSVFRFLDIYDGFVPDTSRSYDDVASVPRSRAFERFLRRPSPLKTALEPLLPQGFRDGVRARLHHGNLTQPPPLPHDAREELAEDYREDVFKLQELLGRDLSGWVDVSGTSERAAA
jgi:Sulfotransferase family